MTWNKPIPSSVIENYRGSYCVKAYNDAESRFQCGIIVFAWDAVAGELHLVRVYLSNVLVFVLSKCT